MVSLRRGLTLIEVLVVLAIVGLLLALIMPAVQQVRQAAIKMQSQNKLRQLPLAQHQFWSLHGDRSIDAQRYSVHMTLLMHIDPIQANPPGLGRGPVWYPALLSPADPTIGALVRLNSGNLASNVTAETTSYPCNANAYGPSGTPAGIRDGLSSTIAFAEHYSTCYDTAFTVSNLSDSLKRRGTFADPNIPNRPDVVPVTTGNPPVSMPSVPGKTFQARPPLEQCDSTIPQTPHAGGMLIACFDGSVRTVAPSVSPNIFWAMVTLDAGEVVSDW